jgi:hypothetical protein
VNERREALLAQIMARHAAPCPLACISA